MPRSFGTNDTAEAEKAVLLYADMVYRLAFARTGNKQDADDVFQEVFLRYVRKRPLFQNEEHQKAWLLRVTVNCSNRLLGSPFRRRSVPLLDEMPGDPDEKESQLELAAALRRLPAAYREVIHLFYYEDYTCEQIADALRRKPSTVRMQLTRARRMLQDTMKGDPDCESE